MHRLATAKLSDIRLPDSLVGLSWFVVLLLLLLAGNSHHRQTFVGWEYRKIRQRKIKQNKKKKTSKLVTQREKLRDTHTHTVEHNIKKLKQKLKIGNVSVL